MPTRTRKPQKPQRPDGSSDPTSQVSAEFDDDTASMEETDPGPIQARHMDGRPPPTEPPVPKRGRAPDTLRPGEYNIHPYELSEEGGLDENALDRLVWNLQDLNGGIRVILEILKNQNERHNAAEHNKQEFWSALAGSVHTLREVAAHLAQNRVSAVIIAAGIFIGIVSCSGVDPSDVDMAVEIAEQLKKVIPGMGTLFPSEAGALDELPSSGVEPPAPSPPSSGSSGLLVEPSAN